MHRGVERRDATLAQRANAEQQRGAFGGREPQRARQAVREVDEHAAFVDGDQQVLARIAIGRTDLREQLEIAEQLLAIGADLFRERFDRHALGVLRDVRHDEQQAAQPLGDIAAHTSSELGRVALVDRLELGGDPRAQLVAAHDLDRALGGEHAARGELGVRAVERDSVRSPSTRLTAVGPKSSFSTSAPSAETASCTSSGGSLVNVHGERVA